LRSRQSFRFAEIRTRRTFEEAIDQIADAIRSGQLAVGDRLPAERAMALQMKISRPSIREAIRTLSEVGVIEVRRSGGMYVRSDDVPFNFIHARSRVRVGEIGGLLEARRLLEPQVARLASVRANETDFAALQTAIDMQSEAVDDRDRFLRYELRFHLGLARGSGNDTVVSMMKLVLGKLEMVMDMALFGHDPVWTIDIHQRTLDAVRGADLDEIDHVMDEHLAYLESLWAEETRLVQAQQIPAFLFPEAADPPTPGRERIELGFSDSEA
jgi:DNA-binding FadR family transcriptional regulator